MLNVRTIIAIATIFIALLLITVGVSKKVSISDDFSEDDQTQEIERAFREGDLNQINLFLDQSVGVNLPGDSGVMSKNDAFQRIKSFYFLHPVEQITDVKIIPGNGDGPHVMTGMLRTPTYSYHLTTIISKNKIDQIEIWQ